MADDPKTILEYATQRKGAAKKAATDAQTQLAQAQQGIAADRAELADDTAAFASLEKEAAEIRKQLGVIATPADGAALVDALEQIIIRARTKQAAILKAGSALRAAQTDADRAQADLGVASANLAKAEKDLLEANRADKQRLSWKTALAAPPRDTLQADAGKALDATAVPEGVTFKKASDRIEADIPTKLLERARGRRDDAAASVTTAADETLAAETAALTERKNNGGLAGKVEEPLAAFQQAETTVKDFATNAKPRFDQALALLAQVADPARSPLTSEQRARIDDSTLAAARGDAVDEEETKRDAAQTTLTEARGALKDEILKAKALGKNPDDVLAVQNARSALPPLEGNLKTADDNWRAEEKVRDQKLADVAAAQAKLSEAIQAAIAAKKNPDTDGTVIADKGALSLAQGALETAESDYKKSKHGVLHAWEAAVPDSMWRLLDDFERAVQMLKELSDSKAAAELVLDLDAAEAAYVKARLAADASASVIQQLASERDSRAARLQDAREAESGRLFSALRGDN